MNEMIKALLDLHTVNFVRYRLLTEALEKKGCLTRSELDVAYDNFPDTEKEAIHAKTKKLFLSLFEEYF